MHSCLSCLIAEDTDIASIDSKVIILIFLKKNYNMTYLLYTLFIPVVHLYLNTTQLQLETDTSEWTNQTSRLKFTSIFLLFSSNFVLFFGGKGKKLADLATEKGHQKGSSDASGTQVEQGRLGSFENVHDGHGGEETEQVSNKTSFKVILGIFPLRSLGSQMTVKTKTEGNHDTGNDNVTQSKHREFFPRQVKPSTLQNIPREQQLDRDIKRPRHTDHDIRPKDPKNVVKKQSGEQDHSRFEGIQVEDFDGGEGKGQSQQIGTDPIFGQGVVGSEDSSQDESENPRPRDFQSEFSLLVAMTH